MTYEGRTGNMLGLLLFNIFHEDTYEISKQYLVMEEGSVLQAVIGRWVGRR